MRRKVIQLAEKTLVVSLPSKWVKANNVKKGSELEVEPAESRLIISTEKCKKHSKAKIHLTGHPELARKRINTAYKKGYDELELTFSDPKIINAIKKELDILLGFEIVKRGEKHCIIKNIASAMDEEFDNILRRLFLMMLEMGRDSIDAIKKKEYGRLKEISTSEQTNDKLTNVCKRILNKQGYQNPERTILMYAMLRDLEKIADVYEAICLHGKMTKEQLSIYQDLNKYFEAVYKLHYDFNEDNATKLVLLQQKLQKNLSSQVKDHMTHHLLNLFNKIKEMTGPIYAMAL